MNAPDFPNLLVEFLVKSAIMIALGFAAITATKRFFSAEARHGLWLRIFSMSLVVPLLLVAVPRWKIVPNLWAEPAAETPVVRVEPQLPSVMAMTAPVMEVSALTAPIVSTTPIAEPAFRFSWAWTLFAIWAGGVTVILLRAIPGGLFLRRIERSAAPAGGKMLAKFDALNQTPRRDRTTLLLSPLVKSPFTWGLGRARIVLPESATRWSEEELEMILLHELEHVRRNDALAILVSRLFLALNWVNPFAWIAIHRAAQLREEACDWRVIDAGYASENYAAMLFRQAKTSVSPILQTCATAVAETGTIETRIKMILNHPPGFIRGNTTLLARLSGLATLAAILAIGISGCADSESVAADAEVALQPTATDSEAIAAVEEKLKTLTLPQVEFKNTPLKDVLAFLQRRSAELDPVGEGFDIVSTAEDADAIRISLRLTDAPLAEVLRYVTSLASMKYRVVPGAVVVLPLTAPPLTELYTNVYQVTPDFLKSGGKEATTVLEILKNAGITFPEGASAIFNPETSQLIIRNTADQMELVEAYMLSLKDQAPPLSPEVEAYLRKIESIILPSVEFVETPLMDAVELLHARSVELDAAEPDPAKKGINIVVSPGSIRDVLVNLKLTNVPLSEALRYTAELAGGGLRVDESAVVIGYEKSTPRSYAESAAAQVKIEANREKLDSIIIPSIEFAETPLTDALQFLQVRSVELDVDEPNPDMKGLNFILDTGKRKIRKGGALDPFSEDEFEGEEEKKDVPVVDLKLSNIPLSAALKYTCDLAGMEYLVEPHNILIRPKR